MHANKNKEISQLADVTIYHLSLEKYITWK